MTVEEYLTAVVADFTAAFPSVSFQARTSDVPFRMDRTNLMAEVYLTDLQMGWTGVQPKLQFETHMEVLWVSDRGSHFDWYKTVEIATAFAAYAQTRTFGDRYQALVATVENASEELPGDQNWLWRITWTDEILPSAEFDYQGHLIGLPDVDLPFVSVPARDLGPVTDVAVDPIVVEQA